MYHMSSGGKTDVLMKVRDCGKKEYHKQQECYLKIERTPGTCHRTIIKFELKYFQARGEYKKEIAAADVLEVERSHCREIELDGLPQFILVLIIKKREKVESLPKISCPKLILGEFLKEYGFWRQKGYDE
ncbi:hypothetical protein ABEB36_014841 [Hypothenemus hampei]|uniref:Uncharacterized protein n=1 Tax=Hypothenemus hampei TaxID=57062 RepID=A0ABD1E119_HYPHA